MVKIKSKAHHDAQAHDDDDADGWFGNVNSTPFVRQ